MPKQTGPYGPAGPPVKELIQKVRHNLLMLPYYGVFDDLGFTVSSGTLTLLTEVTGPALRADARDAVRKITGVFRYLLKTTESALPPTGRLR